MNVFCQNDMHLHLRTSCSLNPTGVRLLREDRGGWGNGGVGKTEETEKFTITDGR